MLIVIKILPTSDATGRYLLNQPAFEVAEVPGAQQRRWLGRSAEAFSLGGPVVPAALRAVLDGRPPGTGIHAPARRQRVAFDVVIAAPKAVSILFASPEREIAAEVLRAHDRSVEETLSYLEQRAASVVRVQNRERLELGVDGLLAAGFTHGLSRSGDPHLHTHLLVANLAHAQDGRFAPVASGGLRFHAQAADALYRAQLRAELSRRLHVQFERRTDGALEIKGISDSMLRAFSGRGAEVRGGNRYSTEERWAPRRDVALEEWARRLKGVEPTVELARQRVGHHLDEHRLAGALSGRSPRAREALAAFCDAAGPGLDASVAARLLARSGRELGRGVAEPALPERLFLASPKQQRTLGPRPLRERALERWWAEADRLERTRGASTHRERSGTSLERSDRQGSSR